MPETRLLEALEEEAKRERESILSSAREEAAKILEGARKRKEELLLAESQRVREELRRERDRRVNVVRREEKEKLLRLKWEIVEGVFNEALETLIKIWEERKERIALCLAEEVLEMAKEEGLEGTLYVDRSVLKAVKRRFGREIRVEGREGMDGAILSVRDGRVEYRNTIKARLKRARKRLLHEIGAILFG